MRLALFMFIACAALPSGSSESFSGFVKKYAIKFQNAAEEAHQKLVFAAHEVMLKNISTLWSEAKSLFNIKTTRWSGYDENDMKTLINLRKATPVRFARSIPVTTRFSGPPLAPLPDTVDWRTKGLVSSVKDQGQCGSCWTFSTAAGLEAYLAKKTGKLQDLSEQNILDCAKRPKYAGVGCNGGNEASALQYVMDSGIDSENSYPYKAAQGSCQFRASAAIPTYSQHQKAYVRLPAGDEQALMNAVATVGPIMVSINADDPGFVNYNTGVYSNPRCSRDRDHAVIIVGYGTDTVHGKPTPYWLVKNSWGTDMGDQGYWKMLRGTNECGIADEPLYPVLGGGSDNLPTDSPVVPVGPVGPVTDGPVIPSGGATSCTDAKSQCQAKCGRGNFSFSCRSRGTQVTQSCQCAGGGDFGGDGGSGGGSGASNTCAAQRTKCQNRCGGSMSFSCQSSNGQVTDFSCNC